MSVVYVPAVPRYVVEVKWPGEEKWSPHRGFHSLTEAEEAADKEACRSPQVSWRVVDTQPEAQAAQEEGDATGGTVYIDVIPRIVSTKTLDDLRAWIDSLPDPTKTSK